MPAIGVQTTHIELMDLEYAWMTATRVVASGMFFRFVTLSARAALDVSIDMLGIFAKRGESV